MTYKRELLKTFPIEEFEFEEDDILILCLSEPWIPPMIRELFFVWVDLVKEKFFDAEMDFTIVN